MGPAHTADCNRAVGSVKIPNATFQKSSANFHFLPSKQLVSDWLDLMIAWNLLAALVLFGLSLVPLVREETLSAYDRFGHGALPSMGKIRHQHCFLRRLEHKTSLYNFKRNDILLDALCGFG